MKIDLNARGHTVEHIATLLALGNSDYRSVLPFNSALPTGQLMALANDTAFDGANVNVALTERIMGAVDRGLAATLTSLVPDVPSPDRFNYLSFNEAGQYADVSGVKQQKNRTGEFAKVEVTGTDTDARLFNKGLQILIPNSEGGNNSMIQERYAAFLVALLDRAEIIEVINALDAASSAYATKTWSSGTSVTPDADLAGLVVNSGDLRGVDANRVAIGSGDWLLRLGACQRNANPGVSTAALMTPEQVAAMLDIDTITRVKARKGTLAATAKSKVLSGAAYAYQASPTAVKEDGSNILRFVGTEGTQVVTENIVSSDCTRIVVKRKSNIITVNSVGVVKLTIN